MKGIFCLITVLPMLTAKGESLSSYAYASPKVADVRPTDVDETCGPPPVSNVILLDAVPLQRSIALAGKPKSRRALSDHIVRPAPESLIYSQV